MIGAIARDIIGFAYEGTGMKSTAFKLFDIGSVYTNDAILTVAVADCILHGKEYGSTFKEYRKRYPYAGYGFILRKWLGRKDLKPYNK